MDSFLTANLKAFAAQQTQQARCRSLPPGGRPSSREEPAKVEKFERRLLLEQRRRRSTMDFMSRMGADTDTRQAMLQVCAMRQDPDRRVALDRAVERLRPAPATSGPVVASHDHRSLYEGHSRKMNWAPLECY
eukprot:SRR837773.25448.p3 GENE.SRR837773.25448~~SRR837773.25448.p3  ORF type:complete len:141 (+),score=44.15 SRR837773.25448:25-423(+)